MRLNGQWKTRYIWSQGLHLHYNQVLSLCICIYPLNAGQAGICEQGQASDVSKLQIGFQKPSRMYFCPLSNICFDLIYCAAACLKCRSQL